MINSAATYTPKTTKASSFIAKYKRQCFAITQVLIAAIILATYYIGDNSQLADVRAWFVVLFIFTVIPVADYFIGEDDSNFDEDTMEAMKNDKYYRFITMSVLPIYACLLVWGMYVFTQWEALTLLGQIGWITSIGVYGGSIGITSAHELVHKTQKLENITGGLILSLVSYAGFKIEHVYGHHVNVSTPVDTSSSRYNQSLYSFIPQAYVKNFTNAWGLQKKRLARRNLGIFSLKNELIVYNSISILILFAFITWQGWMGAIYFLGTCFVAFTLLEIINYIEHYGLHRQKMENGRYERVTPEHSWNSNYLISNLYLFHLQRHSDHHANAIRRYQSLKSYDYSPQLPAGYATMSLLALIPPIWRKVMNPRVEAYYEGRMDVLTDG